MTAALAIATKPDHGAMIERVVIQGDLSKLSPNDRATYYAKVCESIGLNPLTRPFEYLTLNGKQILYARRDCTDQLRNIHGVTVTITSRERIEDVYVVTARATLPNGRADESTGAVAIGNLKGELLANALMKSETKAKRRVTLSICGLSMLDETELDTVPAARPVSPREHVAPHADTHDSPEGGPVEGGPFESLMARLKACSVAMEASQSYDEVLAVRAEIGSKGKQTALTKDIQTASEAGLLVEAQRKALGKEWQRIARRLESLEKQLAPGPEDAYRDEPEDELGGRD